MENVAKVREGYRADRVNLRSVADALGLLLPDVADGVAPALAEKWLLDVLDEAKEDCRERNVVFHTPHQLRALWNLPQSIMQAAFNSIGWREGMERMRQSRLQRELVMVRRNAADGVGPAKTANEIMSEHIFVHET